MSNLEHIVVVGSRLRCKICGLTRHYETAKMLDQNDYYGASVMTHRRRFEMEHAHRQTPKSGARYTVAVVDIDAELEPVDRLLAIR